MCYSEAHWFLALDKISSARRVILCVSCTEPRLCCSLVTRLLRFPVAHRSISFPSQLDDLELRPVVIETTLPTVTMLRAGGPSHNVRVSAQQTVAGRCSSTAAHSVSRGVPSNCQGCLW